MGSCDVRPEGRAPTMICPEAGEVAQRAGLLHSRGGAGAAIIRLGGCASTKGPTIDCQVVRRVSGATVTAWLLYCCSELWEPMR